MQPFKGFAAFAQDLIASAETARSRPLLKIGKKTRRASPDKLPKSKNPEQSTLCVLFSSGTLTSNATKSLAHDGDRHVDLRPRSALGRRSQLSKEVLHL
ncbi:hypothetical protein SS05631_c11100 [Sinorhizobium sp. CCBAU 05631]|nr:hypothetical protein SS05631_c11100 [Sinorhizobium sp. CCBAU 05631]